MIGGVVDEDDSGMVVGERRMPLGDGTSRGPDDKFDNNILAMRLAPVKIVAVRAVQNAGM